MPEPSMRSLARPGAELVISLAVIGAFPWTARNLPEWASALYAVCLGLPALYAIPTRAAALIRLASRIPFKNAPPLHLLEREEET